MPQQKQGTKRVNSEPEADGAALKRCGIKPYTRWRHEGPPITEYEHIPKGWNSDDNDIHEDDILANIERCKNRIEDGIMPQWWEKTLKKYERFKAEIDKEIQENKGLDLYVIYRLKDLEGMKNQLENNGDKRKLLPNINAIIKAYRSDELAWQDGLVTYWAKGKNVSGQPKEFTWENYDFYCKKHGGGSKDFWVEGLHGPGSLCSFPVVAPNNRAFNIEAKDPQSLHEIDFTLRIPARATKDDDSEDIQRESEEEGKTNDDEEEKSRDDEDTSIELNFLDDTGAAVMVIYEDDLERIENKAHQTATVVGGGRLNGIFSHSFIVIHRIEVNMRDTKGNYLAPWTTIQVAVIGGDRPMSWMRLSGPWMRHRFFVGTSPNKRGLLCVAKNKTLFKRLIEAIPQKEVDGKIADLTLSSKAPGHLFAFPRGWELKMARGEVIGDPADNDDNVEEPVPSIEQ
ncbi:uncharacterized protein N7483_009095 [Penicillium malachiteum]|uniref:uncharacterized protein n=1 Tax=Penicillium malachiteum TaxID=1324776 RepID=UPI00254942D2|nr:uncharacterized protein N7483_009095 [Penicillium malachiteum]KAJ5721161.1 hypothetical protein N7483_009095 [Penicillium malachiteum]